MDKRNTIILTNKTPSALELCESLVGSSSDEVVVCISVNI